MAHDAMKCVSTPLENVSLYFCSYFALYTYFHEPEEATAPVWTNYLFEWE